MRRVLATLAVLFVTGSAGAETQSPVQSPPEVPATLRVFIDCPEGCDTTFFRSDLDFVNHVIDREVADVHVLVTEANTGGGGTEYTVALIGLGPFASLRGEQKYVHGAGETDDAERRGVLRAIRLGLVPFLARTALAGSLDLVVRRPAGTEEEQARRQAQTTDDPWNFWVFRVRGDTNLSGEEASKSVSLDGSFSASRVTEQWKTSIRIDSDYRRNTYNLDEENEEPYVTISRDSSVSGLQVRSLGPHWGVGVKGSLESSTYTNHLRLWEVSPAIEYNVFPYSETTRRQLTFTYSLGFQYASYRQMTLYGKLDEALMSHELALNWDMKQPWGTLDVEIDASQYLPDTSKNRLAIEADTEVRLFKGFSLDVRADVAFIRDQVYLPARGATEQEILLRLRQIRTSYDYGFSVGFSYSFGSVYNNVVNSRLSAF